MRVVSWGKLPCGMRPRSCSFPCRPPTRQKISVKGERDPQARAASKHTIVCLFQIFPDVSPWQGFPWLDKSVQTSSLAFHVSVSGLRSHLGQAVLLPIAALSSAGAAVLQHAERPGRACFGSHEAQQ